MIDYDYFDIKYHISYAAKCNIYSNDLNCMTRNIKIVKRAEILGVRFNIHVL